METKLEIKLFNAFISYASIMLFIHFRIYSILLIFAFSTIVFLIYGIKNYKNLILFVSGLILVILCSLFIPYIYNLKTLFNLIDDKLMIRKSAINFISNHYDTESAAFIKTLVLNAKDYKSEIYNSINNISISHLFVISGIHVSVFCSVIAKLIKNKIVNNIICFTFCSIIFYLSGFSISIVRVIIYLVVKLVFSKRHYSSIINTILTGLIMIFIFNKDCIGYSFMLSIIASLFISFVNETFENKYMKMILITCFVNLVLSPIIISFNNEFNILTFINSFVFSYPILFIYYFELFFCWVPFLFKINTEMINWISNYLSDISNNQSFIELNSYKNIIVAFYFLVISGFNIYKFYQINKKPILINYNNMYELRK